MHVPTGIREPHHNEENVFETYLCCKRDAEKEERRTDGNHHPGLPLSQLRELIQNAGDNVLDDGELGVEAESEEHQEEEQRPESGDWQSRHQFWVGHKRQTCGI